MVDNDINDKYLDMSDGDIDNLLFGIKINKVESNENICLGCKKEELVLDESNGYYICQNCGMINNEFLDKKENYSYLG